MAKTILLIGTLDSKGTEYEYVRDLVRARGHRPLVMDAGVLGEPAFTPDIPAGQVAAAGGASLEDLRAQGDRGRALEVMGLGARSLAVALVADGSVDAVLAMGGSGATSIASTAMKALPVGLPKLIVSTMASGNVGAVRRRQGHHHDVLGGRRRRTQPGLPAGVRQCRRSHLRDGRAAGAQGGRKAGDRGHDVRRHHALRRSASLAARGERLRDPRVPRRRQRRTVDGVADHRRVRDRASPT